jgi:hypothetical protein
MWVVANYKPKEFLVFKNKIQNSLNNVLFYRPCYQRNKVIKPLLGNYCFIKHSDFENHQFLKTLQYTKGLNYFLTNYKESQDEIINFISFLKKNEQEPETINLDFFFNFLKTKGVFLSGIFKDLTFDFIRQNKKTLTVSIEDCLTPITINKHKVSVNFL